MTKAVEQFAAQRKSADRQILADLCDFDEWQTQQRGTAFIPDETDDVSIRSYLLHLKLSGFRRSTLQDAIVSLKCFYDWAQANHLIAKSPFDNFQFDRPLLSRAQIRRREEAGFANPMDPEIAHLRALNQLAEHLNRSADIHTLWRRSLRR